MQIILLERVAKLGQMGEVVNVKEGYARNFLLPQGKALRVNDANLARFEADKAQMEARNLETKKEADALAAKLDGETFIVIRSASDGGNLYGSELQAAGKSIAELAAEEEAAAEFEIQELFDDIGAAGMEDFGDDAAPAPAAEEEAASDDEDA